MSPRSRAPQKSVSIPATAPEPPRPAASLEERVRDASRRLALIHSSTIAFSFAEFDESLLLAGVDVLMDSIRCMAQEAYDLLEPVADAPFDVLSWEPQSEEVRR